MARHLHFDCFNGISGDMTLGALVDLGVPVEELQAGLSRLPFPFTLRAEKVKRQGIMGTLLHVEVEEAHHHDQGHGHDHGHGDHDHGHDHATAPHTHSHDHGHSHGHSHGHTQQPGDSHGHHVHHQQQQHDHHHEAHSHSHSHSHAEPERAHAHTHTHDEPHDHHHHDHVHLSDVVAAVKAAGLPERVTRRAIAAYELIAEAEAKVHGSTKNAIHFHEVGARDAILDVAGAMLAVELLGIESFSCSVIATGWGTVKCDHGIMPVPAPATAEILRDMPTRATVIEGELTTPTGAAILKTLVGGNPGAAPAMKVAKIGYGAGTKKIEGHPNYLRASLGETADAASALPVEREEVIILETEIDDMPPESAGYVLTRLLAAGALDAQLQPVQMKKNRPGIQLRVLAKPSDSERLAEIVLRETSTFGVRVTRAERLCLGRRIETVQTPLGQVQVKLGLWGDETLKVSPEFESCRALAESTGRPLSEIYELARRAAQS